MGPGENPDRFLPSILEDGLEKMQRHNVRLSLDKETAIAVGSRRGRAVVLKIDAGRMVKDGAVFFLSENGVWLVDAVPPKYIEVVDAS